MQLGIPGIPGIPGVPGVPAAPAGPGAPVGPGGPAQKASAKVGANKKKQGAGPSSFHIVFSRSEAFAVPKDEHMLPWVVLCFICDGTALRRR